MQQISFHFALKRVSVSEHHQCCFHLHFLLSIPPFSLLFYIPGCHFQMFRSQNCLLQNKPKEITKTANSSREWILSKTILVHSPTPRNFSKLSSKAGFWHYPPPLFFFMVRHISPPIIKHSDGLKGLSYVSVSSILD